MNRRFLTEAGMLAVLIFCVAAPGWTQEEDSPPPLPEAPPKQAEVTPPKPSKEELAYRAFYDGRTGDPAHTIASGEGFLKQYPRSTFLGRVYDVLTGAYLQTNQTAKLMDIGAKALALNPDDVEVLPVMAWALGRQANTKTPEGQQQMQKAGSYAHHGMDLVNSLVKPDSMDEDSFAKAKNDKLSMCHSSLGAIAVKTEKYADAIPELTAAVQLAIVPDQVDYYLLGFAEEQTNHFTGALDAYGKCSVTGSPMQNQCKSGIDDVSLKAKTELEAPN